MIRIILVFEHNKISMRDTRIKENKHSAQKSIDKILLKFEYLNLYMDKPANTLWPIDPVGIATVNSKLKQNISIIYLSTFVYL